MKKLKGSKDEILDIESVLPIAPTFTTEISSFDLSYYPSIQDLADLINSNCHHQKKQRINELVGTDDVLCELLNKMVKDKEKGVDLYQFASDEFNMINTLIHNVKKELI